MHRRTLWRPCGRADYGWRGWRRRRLHQRLNDSGLELHPLTGAGDDAGVGHRETDRTGARLLLLGPGALVMLTQKTKNSVMVIIPNDCKE